MSQENMYSSIYASHYLLLILFLNDFVVFDITRSCQKKQLLIVYKVFQFYC